MSVGHDVGQPPVDSVKERVSRCCQGEASSLLGMKLLVAEKRKVGQSPRNESVPDTLQLMLLDDYYEFVPR